MDASRENRLAEVALFALRAALPDPAQVGDLGYFLLPDFFPIDRSRMIAALAAAAKPICCASVAMGPCLGVACWPLPDYEQRLNAEGRSTWRIESYDDLRLQLLRDGGADSVGVRGFGTDIVLTWDEYFTWGQEYTILNGVTRLAIQRDGAQGSTRIGALLMVWAMSPSGAVGGRTIPPKVDSSE